MGNSRKYPYTCNLYCTTDGFLEFHKGQGAFLELEIQRDGTSAFYEFPVHCTCEGEGEWGSRGDRKECELVSECMKLKELR